MGTDRDPVPKGKAFVRIVVVLLYLCILCIQGMEALSFDCPAKTYVVKRFPTSAKVFVYGLARTRTRDRDLLSHVCGLRL